LAVVLSAVGGIVTVASNLTALSFFAFSADTLFPASSKLAAAATANDQEYFLTAALNMVCLLTMFFPPSSVILQRARLRSVSGGKKNINYGNESTFFLTNFRLFRLYVFFM
jgi:hypothetical protein